VSTMPWRVLSSDASLEVARTYESSHRSTSSIWSPKWTAVARKVGESRAASLITTGLHGISMLPLHAYIPYVHQRQRPRDGLESGLLGLLLSHRGGLSRGEYAEGGIQRRRSKHPNSEAIVHDSKRRFAWRTWRGYCCCSGVLVFARNARLAHR
jgi:hypothetical protein